jgi:hypothetical protein
MKINIKNAMIIGAAMMIVGALLHCAPLIANGLVLVWLPLVFRNED